MYYESLYKVILVGELFIFFFFKLKPVYEMRISDWSSDVCSADLAHDVEMPLDPADEAIEILNRALRLALDDIVEIPVEVETGQPLGLQDGTRRVRQEGIVDGKSQLRAADQPWCRQRSEIGQAEDRKSTRLNSSH